MDDRNIELNPEELEQGAGGVDITDSPRFKEARKKLRVLKAKGRTKQEAIDFAHLSGDNFMASIALKFWDEF